jgi:hypothetical protein
MLGKATSAEVAAGVVVFLQLVADNKPAAAVKVRKTLTALLGHQLYIATIRCVIVRSIPWHPSSVRTLLPL